MDKKEMFTEFSKEKKARQSTNSGTDSRPAQTYGVFLRMLIRPFPRPRPTILRPPQLCRHLPSNAPKDVPPMRCHHTLLPRQSLDQLFTLFLWWQKIIYHLYMGIHPSIAKHRTICLSIAMISNRQFICDFLRARRKWLHFNPN